MRLIKRLAWTIDTKRMGREDEKLKKLADKISLELTLAVGEDFQDLYYGSRKKIFEVSPSYTFGEAREILQLFYKYAKNIVAFANDNRNKGFKNKIVKLIEDETDSSDLKSLTLDCELYKRIIIRNKSKFEILFNIFKKINKYCGYNLLEEDDFKEIREIQI